MLVLDLGTFGSISFTAFATAIILFAFINYVAFGQCFKIKIDERLCEVWKHQIIPGKYRDNLDNIYIYIYACMHAYDSLDVTCKMNN